MKTSFLSEIFQFLEVKFSIYLNRSVFVMIVITLLGKREPVPLFLFGLW